MACRVYIVFFIFIFSIRHKIIIKIEHILSNGWVEFMDSKSNLLHSFIIIVIFVSTQYSSKFRKNLKFINKIYKI